MSTFRQDLEAAREDVNDLIFTSDAGKFVEAHNKLTRFLSRPDLVSIEEVEREIEEAISISKICKLPLMDLLNHVRALVEPEGKDASWMRGLEDSTTEDSMTEKDWDGVTPDSVDASGAMSEVVGLIREYEVRGLYPSDVEIQEAIARHATTPLRPGLERAVEIVGSIRSDYEEALKVQFEGRDNKSTDKRIKIAIGSLSEAEKALRSELEPVEEGVGWEDQVREFLEEVARNPYTDSNPASLLDTLATRARHLIDNQPDSEEVEG